MKKISILIIEDEKALLETLKLKLSRENFLVETAEDGKEGLVKAKKIKPDLILLDLVLPSVNGEKILEIIKKDQNLKDIIVIVISNSGQPVEIDRLLTLGADDYIIKADFSIDEILERVHNTLEKQKGRPDVLIAEDEMSLRILLSKKIRIEKLRVITALDGESTLKNILEFKPRVVVLDLLLPGFSGLEVLQALKQEKKFNKQETKIIILSNYSGKEDDPLIQEMSQGYFIKSNIDINEAVDAIKKLL